MTDYKYNYVIVGGPGFYDVAYNDLKSLSNVKYLTSYVDGIKSSLLRILTRLNFNLRINRYIRSPFRHIVFPQMLPITFEREKPVCYIFFNLHFALFESGYIEYLRRQHRDAKFVLYMQDIIGSLPYYDINKYKELFDCVLSYDKGDCEKYGLEYYPTPYSKIDISTLRKQEPVDVYFCGKAKNRYSEIIKAYNKCIAKGLSCRFFIYGLPEKEKIAGDGLIYDQPLSYEENLSHVISCKCILEIMQKDAVGFTPRLWEAIFYNKHLLTNNKISQDLYNRIIRITDVEDIEQMGDIDGDNNLTKIVSAQHSKSPTLFLNRIESLLNE